jgi:hypothetical protein
LEAFRTLGNFHDAARGYDFAGRVAVEGPNRLHGSVENPRPWQCGAERADREHVGDLGVGSRRRDDRSLVERMCSGLIGGDEPSADTRTGRTGSHHSGNPTGVCDPTGCQHRDVQFIYGGRQ